MLEASGMIDDDDDNNNNNNNMIYNPILLILHKLNVKAPHGNIL